MRGITMLTVAMLLASSAVASTLDWGTVDYPAGAQNVTFTDVDGTGVDITFSWSDPFNYQANWEGTPLDLPDDDATQTVFGQDGLWFPMPQTQSLVIEFSDTVTDVQFSFVDFDGTDPNVEHIRIKGFDSNGAVPGTGFLPSFFDGGADVVFVPVNVGDGTPELGEGLSIFNGGLADTTPWGPGYEDHVAEVGFIGQGLTKVGLAMKNVGPNRGQILSNIEFTAPIVPEPASMSLLAIGGLALLRRRK